MTEAVSVFSDVVCHLGEGPAAFPSLGRLFWFDILEKRLLEKPFSGSGTIVHDLPVNASAMAVIDGDRQLLAAHDGLYVREVGTGRLRLHTPLEAENAATRSNDARVHPCGAFWVSTMSRTFDDGAGGIWWFRKGELRRIVDGLSIPNAISFAPDGSYAYYADSKASKVWRIETDPATGVPTGEPKVFLALGPGDGGPDGAVVDADGLFWNARWGASALVAHAPDGTVVRTVRMPARQCSCPAFIGPDADRIAVTSAYEGMDAAARAADPLAGQTFRVDIPVRGRFDPPVAFA